MSDSNIINLFVNAARNGDENTVRSLLLTSKVNINDKNEYNGYTALICAAMHNKESMVSLLIDKGADISIKRIVSIIVFRLLLLLSKNEF